MYGNKSVAADQIKRACQNYWAPPHATVLNLVPRAFPLKNPFFKGKALGTRLLRYCKYTI